MGCNDQLYMYVGKGVMFHQCNARPHTSLVTLQKLRMGYNGRPGTIGLLFVIF